MAHSTWGEMSIQGRNVAKAPWDGWQTESSISENMPCPLRGYLKVVSIVA